MGKNIRSNRTNWWRYKRVHITKPATETQVEVVEKKLGLRLPESFRDILLNFSASVEFGWDLDDAVELPQELRGIFASECKWNLSEIVEIEEDRKGWVKECFPNPEDDYDKVWHNKLAFMTVGNGDLIAFDLQKYPDYTPVVYLSHDGGEGHGYILGEDFKDFIDKWTRVGCTGPEDWQMIPFIADSVSGINPDSEHAIKWRDIIGLNIEK
jgi:cell wall assembly regulator SMI1